MAIDACRRVLLLVSDGEQTANTDRQAIITAANTFKSLGGIVIVVGARASGQGFDLLERVATGGFFLNALASNASDVLQQLNYLKSILCAGFCVPLGGETVNSPALDYSSFENWEVISGQTNLVGEDLLNLLNISGLYVELNGGSPATIRTIDQHAIVSGRNYRISFDAAGNQRELVAGQGIKVYLRAVGAADSDPNIFEQTIYPDWDGVFHTYSFSFNATASVSARLYMEQLYTGTAPVIGNFIGNVRFEELSTGTLFLSDTFAGENPVYIPPRCGASEALSAIADPPAPTVTQHESQGDPVENIYKYSYGYSWLTNEGETRITPIAFVPRFPEQSLASRKIVLAAPPERATGVRIWRSLGEIAAVTVSGAGSPDASGQYLARPGEFGGVTLQSPNAWHIESGIVGDPDLGWVLFDVLQPGTSQQYSTAGVLFGLWETTVGGAAPPPTVTNTVAADAGESAMFLLAELSIAQTTYIDEESRADFEARYEPSVTAPTVNTTAVAAGALGTGYGAGCCYYTSGTVAVDALPAIDDPPAAQGNPCSTNGFGGEPVTYAGGEMVDTEYAYYYTTYVTAEGETSTNTTQASGTQVLSPDNAVRICWPTITDPRILKVRIWRNLASLSTQAFPDSNAHMRLLAELDPSPNSYLDTMSNAEWYSIATGGPAPTENTTAVDATDETVSTIIDNCPDCAIGTPGVQVAESPALGNVETSEGPPPSTSFTVEQCAVCPAGFVNLSPTLVPKMTSSFAPSGLVAASSEVTGGAIQYPAWQAFDKTALPWTATAAAPQWLRYQFTAAKTVKAYGVRVHSVSASPKDFEFQGSNDALSWTTLDTRTSITWAPGQLKRWLIETPGAYLYYRLNISATNPVLPVSPTFVSLQELELYDLPANPCASATASNMAAATAAALAAATALLNCVPVYSATRSYTARCESGETGADVTRSATRQSLNSPEEAGTNAQIAAQEAAEAALECT